MYENLATEDSVIPDKTQTEAMGVIGPREQHQQQLSTYDDWPIYHWF